jgi:CBS-domain-containing membrane protein
MNIEQLMTRDVESCHPDDSLDRAAQLMWDNDCGCVPVVDEKQRVHGIITDRDICMSAYTSGQSLKSLRPDVVSH